MTLKPNQNSDELDDDTEDEEKNDPCAGCWKANDCARDSYFRSQCPYLNKQPDMW